MKHGTSSRTSRVLLIFCVKSQFIALFAIMNVGADMIRPRREILRIRISFRRIRNIVPPGD